MNPSNPSVFARPLFAFCIGITMLAAAAIYSPRARADVTFNLSGCTSVSVSGTQVTCAVSSSNNNGSPSCTILINQSPSSSAGGTVALSASCSNYTASAYYWAKNGAPFGTSASISDQLPGNSGNSAVNYRYELNACASASCLPSTSVTISVPAQGGGGGGGGAGWPISCPGFTKTLNIDMPWQSTDSGSRILSSNYGGFGANDALVVRLTAPAGSASYSTGTISMAEYGGGPVTRFSTISTTPCDFSQAGWFSLYNVSTGTSLSYSLQVGGAQGAYVFLMQPGTTYYLNVENKTYEGAPTCPGTCNMFLDFYKPPGT
jgi:hypothetical protein